MAPVRRLLAGLLALAGLAVLVLGAAWLLRATDVARPVAGLPAIGFRARVPAADAVAVAITGDTGWGRLDRHVAEFLARQGVEVTSLNSLRYFWTPRTPEALAADVDRLIRAARLARPRARVLLVGYSMGADVLPFAYNRLPPATRAAVAVLVAINPAADAVFEFRLAQWWHRSAAATRPTAPEFERAARGGVAVVCIRGRRDPDASCAPLGAARARTVDLSGDHDFDGEYHDVAAALLGALATHGGPAAPPVEPARPPPPKARGPSAALGWR